MLNSGSRTKVENPFRHEFGKSVTPLQTQTTKMTNRYIDVM